MRSSLPRIERARPLLGTLVSLRVEGLAEGAAHRAIGEAFAEVAAIHRLMSFHETDSDVARLNREACGREVRVDPRTYEVVVAAQTFSGASGGCFDVTIGAELVSRGILPRPESAPEPDPRASWRDIALSGDGAVRFRRPLWLDLGGIAKGYAVDRALAILRRAGATQACVNAGGDLRLYGPSPERVLLHCEDVCDAVPVLDIADAAVASSGPPQPREGGSPGHPINSPHIDGRHRKAIAAGRFVSVVAQSCMTADALTKIVLALGEKSIPILEEFAATAHCHDPNLDWRHFGVS